MALTEYLPFYSVFLILSILPIKFSAGQSTDRPYRNLYGREDFHLSLNESLAGIVAGGTEFMREWANSMFEEPPDFTPESRNGTEYDFIVIGAGTAGATIASRLTEIPNVTVLLIEAGSSESLADDIPLTVGLLQLNDNINWMYRTEPSNSYCRGMVNHRCNWPRGRVMGGSSVLNFMIATRGNRNDYDDWARMGNEGWSYDEVLPYFKKLETLGIPELSNDTEFHNFDGPVYVGRVPFHTPLAEAFVRAGVEMGFNEVDYNGRNQTGFSITQTTIKNGTRWSSSTAYLHRARDRPNLFVTKNSLVTKILIDESRSQAVGVEFIKNHLRYKVYARKEVILSAGAIGSPQILMLSGIGPAEHLRDMGIDVVVDAPVGENLMDHIAYGGLVFTIDQPVGLSFDDILNPANPYLRDYLVERKGPLAIPGGLEALGFVNVDNTNDPDDWPNVELLFISHSVGTSMINKAGIGMDDEFTEKSFGGANASYTWTILPMLMRPKSRGKILLRNSNIQSHPRIIPNYMDDPDDVRILIKGIRASIDISQTEPMQNFDSRLYDAPVAGCEQFTSDSDEYWECGLRAMPITIYHLSGTCKMGAENDSTAVVNPRLQVIGVQGLRVADVSIMPEVITGHTNIPTFMIAEKLADMVKQDWGYSTVPLTS